MIPYFCSKRNHSSKMQGGVYLIIKEFIKKQFFLEGNFMNRNGSLVILPANRVIKYVLQFLIPFRWLICGQIFVALIWAIEISLRPYVLKILLDNVSGSINLGTHRSLVVPAFLYLGMSALYLIAFRFYDYMWLKINSPLKSHIGCVLMERMMLHSHSLYQTQFSGDISNKINDIIEGVPDILKNIIDHFFSNILAIIVAFGMVWTVHSKFSFALGLWVILFVFINIKLFPRAAELSKRSAAKRSSFIGLIVDIISNMMSVRLFSGETKELENVAINFNERIEVDQARAWFFLKLFTIQGFLFISYEGICLFWLIKGFNAGLITVGDFSLILTINIAIVNFLWSLSKDMGEFTELAGNITQGLSLVLLPIEVKDKPDAKVLVVSKGEIVFDKVLFYYKGAEALFQNESVVIAPGQKVGLVGYSGSGKSTFVNLILRLFDVTSGRILIDDQDVRDVTQDSLRNVIGVIPQDPSLFHRSILENIRYGKFGETKKEVIEAAKRAHANEFIEKLPYGYQSLTGERGTQLSGGQRQRIAIARVFLKNPPILILDEATSQLDTITEQFIHDSLWELMQGKTTLIVAHRLSTLVDMDRILVFEKGSIVQDGTHEQLLIQEGVYKDLWKAQVGGFILQEESVT